jgi:ligand-binding sensor domain-containing protein/signal transduction histidine kinase
LKDKIKTLRLIFLLIILLVCSSPNTQAQPQKYLFTYLGIKDGLLADNILAVQQDEKGFMWIASHNTLQRYDGQRLLNFYQEPGNETSLPPGGIRGIKLDKKNRLWVLSGTVSVGYFDVNTFKYKAVKVKEAPPNSGQAATALYIDRDDNIVLIFVGHGYLTFDESAGAFSTANNPFKIPQGWEPLYLWQDSSRNYWLGSQAGLLKYNALNKQLSYRGHNAEQDPVIRHFEYARTVVFALVDHTGRFWVTSWPENILQIRSYWPPTDTETEWFKPVVRGLKGQYFELQGVNEFTDGSLWMGGVNIFAKINTATTEIEPVFSNASEEYSIRYDHIFSLYEDREKNIWVGTNKGLFWFNPGAQLFKSVSNRTPGKDSTYTSDVTDVLETADGKLLVSTWGTGIFAYDQLFRPVVSKYSDRSNPIGEGMVWCMIQRPNGDIWKGVQDGHIFIYEAASGRSRTLHPPVFENSTIRQMEQDRNGNIWMGTNRGNIVKWEAATGNFVLQHRLKAITGRIYVDNENYVWVCTDKNGVYKINAEHGKIEARYGDQGAPGKVLRINGAADVIRYNDSLVMIAADGLAMLHTRTHQIIYAAGRQNGLPLPHISNLIKDDAGYVWMTTAAGVLSFHPFKGKLSRYNAMDGLPTNTFNVASSVKLKDGRIGVGTNHELIVFDPSRVTVSDYVPPRVQITGFEVMNKTLNYDSLRQLSQVSLQPYEHSVTLQLSTLTFQNTYEIYYRMEGLDKDWVTAGNSKQATFNYLHPGTYFFKTACRDSDGRMGEITELKIRLFPPFWQTWWFYSLLCLVMVALVFLADRIRLRHIHREQQIRSGIAASLHEEVNTTLQNINVLSEIAGFKADENPEQSKGFIYDIKQKSRNMVVAMGDVLWSIDPANDDMDKTINRIHEHIESFRNRHQASIEVRVDPKIKNTKLDMSMRHELMVIFKLALMNLVELLQSTHTVVQLDRGRKSLILNIYSTQNAAGRSPHLISKNINEMKKRAANINATLDIQSDETGSYILLIMKV